MEKVVWKGMIMPGMRNEYIKRHEEIWPEMVKALKESGICNYSIWNYGDELFGYYECPNAEQAVNYKKNSAIMKKWSESMANVMYMVKDPDIQSNAVYQKVFELE